MRAKEQRESECAYVRGRSDDDEVSEFRRKPRVFVAYRLDAIYNSVSIA